MEFEGLGRCGELDLCIGCYCRMFFVDMIGVVI